MKAELKPGLQYEHRFVLPENKMVPALYPEAEEFQEMPSVFATGFMVGFLEWACLKSVLPYLDWPHEQTVGTHVNMSHMAATPAGIEVIARVKLVEVEGRRLKFEVAGFDSIEQISQGTHERFIIDRSRFDTALNNKRKQAGL